MSTPSNTDTPTRLADSWSNARASGRWIVTGIGMMKYLFLVIGAALLAAGVVSARNTQSFIAESAAALWHSDRHGASAIERFGHVRTGGQVRYAARRDDRVHVQQQQQSTQLRYRRARGSSVPTGCTARREDQRLRIAVGEFARPRRARFDLLRNRRRHHPGCGLPGPQSRRSDAQRQATADHRAARRAESEPAK